jgi:hypothetical protein
MGPDCEPFHRSRRIVGRNYVHSLDARRKIAPLVPGSGGSKASPVELAVTREQSNLTRSRHPADWHFPLATTP